MSTELESCLMRRRAAEEVFRPGLEKMPSLVVKVALHHFVLSAAAAVVVNANNIYDATSTEPD